MFADRENISPNNPFKAENFGQYMYARKTASDFSAEMARSIREMLKHWRGEEL